jgi:hypothetical protein
MFLVSLSEPNRLGQPSGIAFRSLVPTGSDCGRRATSRPESRNALLELLALADFENGRMPRSKPRSRSRKAAHPRAGEVPRSIGIEAF